jgi:hypothetical protein
MQLAFAIALTSIYVGIGLAICGVPPRPAGFPLLWFFAPAGIMIGAGFAGRVISAILPVPWVDGRRYGPPPRRVHLSWRAAVRIPAWIPWLLFPGYLLSVMKTYPALDRILWTVAALVLVILALITLRCQRQIRLLRDGDVAMAMVHARDDGEEPHNEIAFQFAAADGTVVSGRAWDLGYKVPIGDPVPVFYDQKNPRNHVVACASRFEAD